MVETNKLEIAPVTVIKAPALIFDGIETGSTYRRQMEKRDKRQTDAGHALDGDTLWCGFCDAGLAFGVGLYFFVMCMLIRLLLNKDPGDSTCRWLVLFRGGVCVDAKWRWLHALLGLIGLHGFAILFETSGSINSTLDTTINHELPFVCEQFLFVLFRINVFVLIPFILLHSLDCIPVCHTRSLSFINLLDNLCISVSRTILFLRPFDNPIVFYYGNYKSDNRIKT